MPKLILIDGPMGAGKSTVSKLLSQKYGFRHLDIDQLKTSFKQWPAGYVYKHHLPIVNEYAKQIVTANLPLTDIVVDKSLGKITAAEFEDIARKLDYKTYKIMLWLKLDDSLSRSATRSKNPNLEINQDYLDMVKGSWNKALDYKNSDSKLVIIDTTNISPDETILAVLQFINK